MNRQRPVQNEKGAVFVIFGVISVVLIGFTAVAVDLSVGYYTQRRIHVATDAGALAGATLLSNRTGLIPTTLRTAVQTEAGTVANLNSVTNPEMSANAVDPSAPIQVGNWDFASTFTDLDDFDPNNPNHYINAVRVPAQRSVSAFFGKIFGFGDLNPAVESIAVLMPVNELGGPGGGCAFPYGIAEPKLFDPETEELLYDYYDYLNPIVIDRDDLNSGNWGKLDIGGMMSSYQNFWAAATGENCENGVAIGDEISPGTGFAALKDVIDWRLENAPIIHIPVVTPFPNGNNADVTALNFIALEIVAHSGEGVNYIIELVLVEDAVGGGAPNEGPPNPGPYLNVRTLVR